MIRGTGKWVGIAVVVLAVTVPWYFIMKTIQHARPVAPPARAHAVVWSDLVFSTPQPLRRWLRARGIAYTIWASRHPSSATRIEHKTLALALPARPARTHAGTDGTHRPAAGRAHRRMTESSAAASAKTTVRRTVELIGLVLLALACLAAFGRGVPTLVRRAQKPRLPVLSVRARLTSSLGDPSRHVLLLVRRRRGLRSRILAPRAVGVERVSMRVARVSMHFTVSRSFELVSLGLAIVIGILVAGVMH
jgi:hypothetical protein